MVTGHVRYVTWHFSRSILTVIVLLFVFWYCHKRGKEVRMEKERDLTELEVEKLDSEYKTTHPDEVFKTTAAPDASIEEVKAGIDEVKSTKETAGDLGGAATTENIPKPEPPASS